MTQLKNNQQEIIVNTEHQELKNGYVMHEEVQRRVVVQPLESYQPTRTFSNHLSDFLMLSYKKAVVGACLVAAAAPGLTIGLLTDHNITGVLLGFAGIHIASKRLLGWVHR